jgi:hypothetical protein
MYRAVTRWTLAPSIGMALLASVLAGPAALAAAPYPDAPTISAVTPMASGALLVSYQAPASDGGSPITSYEVTIDGGSTWYACAPTPNACPLGSLKNGQPYTVSMRAVNAAGPGEASAAGDGHRADPGGGGPGQAGQAAPSAGQCHRIVQRGQQPAGGQLRRQRLGVGTLPRLRFNRDIPDKAVVERHLTVTATDEVTGKVSVVPGAWGWTDNRTVVFRPRSFWPGNSLITITSTNDGAVMGTQGTVALVGSPEPGPAVHLPHGAHPSSARWTDPPTR